MIRRQPRSTPFPYTTLFRSNLKANSDESSSELEATHTQHMPLLAYTQSGEPLVAPLLSDDAWEHLRSAKDRDAWMPRSEEHTSELQSRQYLVCRLLLEKIKK